MGTPIASEIATEMRPARSEARAPQMTRARTSRPISSVPNQCAAEGALRTALQLVASGSCGETHGAKSASATKNATTARPTIAPRRRTRRRIARCHGESSRGAAPIESTVTAAMSAAHARIDQHVGHVREEVEHDVGGGGEEHHALHHGIVAIEDRVDDELAEAGDREH